MESKYRKVAVTILIERDSEMDKRLKRLAEAEEKSYGDVVANVVCPGIYAHMERYIAYQERIITRETGIDITTPIP